MNLRQRKVARVEASSVAEDEWVNHVNELVSQKLAVNSSAWAWGSNTHGKARAYQLYSGGQTLLRQMMAEAAEDDYRGFTLGDPSVLQTKEGTA